MSQLPQIILTASDEVVLKKKAAWAEVGQVVHNANISLTNKASQIKALLITPVSIDDIQNAEAILKDVSKQTQDLINERKLVTSKFDSVTSGLMAHEKSIVDLVPAYKSAIISLKKTHEDKIRQEQDLIAKRKQELENNINFLNEQYNAWKCKISDICSKAFEHALGKGNVTIENLPAYIDKVKSKFKLTDFNIIKPAKFDAAIWDEALKNVDMPPPELMLNYFNNTLNGKFDFYNVAVKNKVDALAAAKAKEETERIEREAELANVKVAAHLETIATADVDVISDIKELKKKYEVDLEDSEQYALLIMTAFVTNYKSVKDGVRVKSMLKLSVEQMATALSWYKNQDNKFEFTGIKFKITEKL